MLGVHEIPWHVLDYIYMDILTFGAEKKFDCRISVSFVIYLIILCVFLVECHICFNFKSIWYKYYCTIKKLDPKTIEQLGDLKKEKYQFSTLTRMVKVQKYIKILKFAIFLPKIYHFFHLTTKFINESLRKH